MGRWVRWFGSAETEGQTAVAVSPSRTKVITVSVAKAREVARSVGSVRSPGMGVTPAPTGAISIEQLAGEMLTAVLVQDGAISRDDEHAALTEHRATGRPVEDILIETGVIAESELLSVLSRRCKVPHLSLERYQVRPEVLETVSPEFARANRVIPLERLGKMLNVATSNPLAVSTFKRLEDETGLRVKPVLASPREVANFLEKFYPAPPEELVSETKEEEAPLSPKQIFKESWLGLVGDEGEEGTAAEEAAGAAGAVDGAAEERAVPLSEDDARAFTRATSAALYRGWERSAGVHEVDALVAAAVPEIEFALVASETPLEKPASPEAPAAAEKEVRTRSPRKKAKKRKKRSKR